MFRVQGLGASGFGLKAQSLGVEFETMRSFSEWL